MNLARKSEQPGLTRSIRLKVVCIFAYKFVSFFPHCYKDELIKISQIHLEDSI